MLMLLYFDLHLYILTMHDVLIQLMQVMIDEIVIEENEFLKKKYFI